MSVNIAQLKKQLQDLGISTNTPGLVGDDRYEELRSRLDAYNAANGNSVSKAKMEDPSVAMPSLSHLSIGEIRSRLADLGENTNTPGLSGDERRFELMRRLINAICGAEEEAVPVVAEPVKSVKPKKLAKPEPVVEPVIVQAPELAPPAPVIEEPVAPDNTVALGDISELKNELKRLVNKRAMAVAAQLSGPHQDAELKGMDMKLNKIDAELSTLKTIKAKTDIKLHIDKFLSEFVHLDAHHGRNPDNYITKLEALRTHVKDQIRERRLAIREEADNSSEYGIAVEEKLKIILSQANLNNLNTTKLQSKARQKLNASKELENKLNAAAPLIADPKAATAAALLIAMSESHHQNTTKNTGTGNASSPKAGGVHGQASHSRQQQQQHHDKHHSSSASERINDIVKHELEAIKHAKEGVMPPVTTSPPEPEVVDPFKSKFLDIKMDIDEVMTGAAAAGGGNGGGRRSRDTSNHNSPEKSQSKDEGDRMSGPMKAALSAIDKSPPVKAVEAKSASTSAAVTAKGFKYDARVDSDSNGDDHAGSSSSDEGGARRRGKKRSGGGGGATAAGGKGKKLTEGDKKESQHHQILRSASKDSDGGGGGISVGHVPLKTGPSLGASNTKPFAASSTAAVAAPPTTLASRSSEDSPSKPAAGEAPSGSRKLGPPPARGAPIDTSRAPPTGTPAAAASSGGSVKMAGPPPPVHNPSNKATNKPAPAAAPAVAATANTSSKNAVDKKKSSDSPSDDEEQEGDSDSDGSDGDDALLRSQIRQHHADAKNYESLHDFIMAEQYYAEALALDPTNIVSLQLFALFLHQKKGELARAEAFFNRGLQIILPGFDIHHMTSPLNKPTVEFFPLSSSPPKETVVLPHMSPLKLPTHAPPSSSGVKLKYIIRFILSFASFLTKSEGDIEGAYALYRKALELDPENPMCMGIFAHFLSQECSLGNGPVSLNTRNNSEEAIELFKKALVLQPRNVLTTMWYAKHLKKIKRFGEAELLYKVAVDNSVGQFKLEPTAICNYATFIYKVRKNPVKAQQLFVDGLARFPNHKGLIKNYCTLLRVYTNLGSAEEVRKKLLTADKTSEAATLRANQILNSVHKAEGGAGDENSNELSNNPSNIDGSLEGSEKKGAAPSVSTNSNSLEDELAKDAENDGNIDEEEEEETVYGIPVNLNIGIPGEDDGAELLNAKLMARVKGTPIVGSPLPPGGVGGGVMSPMAMLTPWSGRDDKKLFFTASYEGTPTSTNHDESISKMKMGGNAILDAKTGKPIKLLRSNTSESSHSLNVVRGVSPSGEGERYVKSDENSYDGEPAAEERDPDYYSGDEID